MPVGKAQIPSIKNQIIPSTKNQINSKYQMPCTSLSLAFGAYLEFHFLALIEIYDLVLAITQSVIVFQTAFDEASHKNHLLPTIPHESPFL